MGVGHCYANGKPIVEGLAFRQLLFCLLTEQTENPEDKPEQTKTPDEPLEHKVYGKFTN